MELEGLRAKVEWEVRRVAAAFQAQSYVLSPQDYLESALQFEVPLESAVILYMTLSTDPVVTVVAIGLLELVAGGDLMFMARSAQGRWGKSSSHPNSALQSRMARGLYCLGIKDDETRNQLPHLSAHEKMELRLSLPREFWPQRWLDEEEQIESNC